MGLLIYLLRLFVLLCFLVHLAVRLWVKITQGREQLYYTQGTGKTTGNRLLYTFIEEEEEGGVEWEKEIRGRNKIRVTAR